MRQFFGCVCGWMIGGNQRMESLNMRGTPIDCSFRFLFFLLVLRVENFWQGCSMPNLKVIAPKMCDLPMDFFLRGMEPGRFAPGTCVQLSGRIRIPKIHPKNLTREPSRHPVVHVYLLSFQTVVQPFCIFFFAPCAVRHQAQSLSGQRH